MKSVFSLVAAVLFLFSANAQHYYNDILATQQSNHNYQLLKKSSFSTMRAASYEADNSPTANFRLQQELAKDKKTLITTTTTPSNVSSVTTSVFDHDRITRVTEEVHGVKNITQFEYDGSGKITRITTQSIDPEHSGGNTTETHHWFYKADGTPDYMIRVKNNTDTVKVEFSYDEQNNLAEERWKRKDKVIETWYYYYNAQRQLTDIVRYNARSRKLLPDFVFEYDANGRVSQMLQILNGSSSYLLWQYNYQENGLKSKEVCYDKQRRLLGRIEYAYSR